MIVLVSWIVLLRGTHTCFHDFCMVHLIRTSPFIQLMIFALVPHILMVRVYYKHSACMLE